MSRGGKSGWGGETGSMETGRVGNTGETQLCEGHTEKCGRRFLSTGKENTLPGKAFLTVIKMCLCLGWCARIAECHFFHNPSLFSSLRITVKYYNPFPGLISELLVSSSPCILISDMISAPTYTSCRPQRRCRGSDKLKPKVASSAGLSVRALGKFVIPGLILFLSNCTYKSPTSLRLTEKTGKSVCKPGCRWWGKKRHQ